MSPPEVRIDRLVLDIPGFDPARAHALAREIGELMAGSGAAGTRGRLAVALDDAEAPDLARRIAAALLERLA
jgi:hypothetical protein